MHADMTTLTIQSNKVVLNEVKDNKAPLEPSYGKNQMIFLANPILFSFLVAYLLNLITHTHTKVA